MCGIGGAVHRSGRLRIPHPRASVSVMNAVLEHRGPDGEGTWIHPNGVCVRAPPADDHRSRHRRPADDRRSRQLDHLQRRDLQLPRAAPRARRGPVPRPTRHRGRSCGRTNVGHRMCSTGSAACSRSRCGTSRRATLFCARDRFGIKPFYYAVVDDVLYFASEIKALLPFLPAIETDLDGLKDYLAFQFCLGGKTLFKGVHELLPGHFLRVRQRRRRAASATGRSTTSSTSSTPTDVFRGADRGARATSRSSCTCAPTSRSAPTSAAASTRASSPRWRRGSRRPTTASASRASSRRGAVRREPLRARARRRRGVRPARGRHRRRRLRRQHRAGHLPPRLSGRRAGLVPAVHGLRSWRRATRKVVLGGQGGDEIFGGYARYLIAYFEQCIKAAIDGTMHAGNFVVTYESIIPNLVALRELQAAAAGVLARRALRRARRALLPPDQPRARPRRRGATGSCSATTRRSRRSARSSTATTCGKESYFDSMTHFDFKTLLPALLQVEDRVSMAHGLESRVPLLDHRSSSSRRRSPPTSSSRTGR